MAITKTATEFLTKEAASISPLMSYVTGLANKTYRAGRWVGNQGWRFANGPARGAYTKGVKPVLTAGLNVSNAVGSAVVNHPKVAIPASALAGVGAYKLKSQINRNILHVDPNMDVTSYRPKPWLGETLGSKVPVPLPNLFSGVRYNNEATKKYFNAQNLITG
jgi:hypothetical protein